MKQETLEEVAEQYTRDTTIFLQGVEEGIREQQERSYSEEEVKDLIEDWTKVSDGLNFNFPTSKFSIWFEQFKKK